MTIIETCNWIAKILFGLEADIPLEVKPITTTPAEWRRCKICDRLLTIKRQKRWPSAATCGDPACSVTLTRRRHARRQRDWRLRKNLVSPGWESAVRAKSRAAEAKRMRDREIPSDTKAA